MYSLAIVYKSFLIDGDFFKNRSKFFHIVRNVCTMYYKIEV